MCLAPRIARERGPNLFLRLRLDRVHDSVLVGERAAEHDETVVDETVHERRVGAPFGLLLHRARRIPVRPGAGEHYVEHGHAAVLPQVFTPSGGYISSA